MGKPLLTNMGVELQMPQKELETYLDCPHVILYTNGHLPLLIDQRYDIADVAYLVEELKKEANWGE